MARTGKPATRHVAAVERALAVLDALVEADDGLGTVETARRTGLSPSTASRVLATLAAGGLVEHEPASGRYRLGVRLVQLGNAVVARLDLRELARPRLEALVAATGETATLSAPAEPDAVTVDFVRSPSSVQGVPQIGRPSVAHATATGKVMLAFGGRPPTGGELPAYTPRTITDPRRLAAEVERVREQGWARAVREREEDLSALAAPVRDGRGELAAVLGIQGPAARLDRAAMRAALGPLLAQAAALSDALGWSPREEEGR
jgi:IclR family acetate operon transcriptional repressor